MKVQTIFSRQERIGIVFFALLSTVLGALGYRKYFQSQELASNLSDWLYWSLSLFLFQLEVTNDLPVSLDIARWLAPATFSFTVIKALMAMLNQHMNMLKIRFFKGHTVIFGLNENTVRVANSLSTEGINTLIVAPQNDSIYWSAISRTNVIPVIAPTMDKNLIPKLNLTAAKTLYISTDNDTENVEYTHRVDSFLNSRQLKNTMQCITQIRDTQLMVVLNNLSLFAEDRPNITTRVVNYQKTGARWLINHFGPERYHRNLANRELINILLVGNEPIISDVLLKFAEIGVYGENTRLRFYLASLHAEKFCSEITAHYPCISQLVDIHPVQCDVMSASVFSTLKKMAPDIGYIFPSGTDNSLLLLNYLLGAEASFPLILCETEKQQNTKWLAGEFKSFDNVFFADIHDHICHFNYLFGNQQDKLAIAIHNNYLVQQSARGETPATNSSLVSWESLPESLKDANRNQADHLLIKFHLLTGTHSPSKEQLESAITSCDLFNLAKMEHRRWLAGKVLEGWQYTDGPKDISKKLSPTIVDWNELSDTEKQKDVDTLTNLPNLLSTLQLN